MKTKPCQQCGKTFEKPYFESMKAWDARHKFCSRLCANEAKKGKPLSDARKQQNRAWSTGRKHTTDAIAKMSGANCHRWKGGKPKCIDCGCTIANVYAKRCFPCYTKQASGENASHWQGGITPENTKIRNSKMTIEWRKAVFERDDYTCTMCHKRGCLLHAHHIKPFSKYPEHRFDTDNGQTLCKPCHKAVHSSVGMKQNALIKAVTT